MNEPRQQLWRRAALTALLASSATLVALLSLEAAFRLGAFLTAKRGFEETLQNAKSASDLRSGQEVSLGQIIRRSHNRKIVYELAPDLSVKFMGAPLTTNGGGIRGRERTPEKPAGTLRVVGIGDSVMFGWGVGDSESYPALLEGLLNNDPQGRRWEVVNTAVPGYNGVQEVEALKEKGLAFQPDIVILGFCGNDLTLPSFLWTDEDYLSLNESFLLRFVRRRLGEASPEDFEIGLEPRQEMKGANQRAWAGEDLPNVPARYRDLVGKDSYRRAMHDLDELARERRFDVLVVAVPGIPRRAHELLDGFGFDLVQTQPLIDRFVHDHAIKAWLGSALAVSATDPHPSKIANSLIARGLYDHIVHESLPRRATNRER